MTLEVGARVTRPRDLSSSSLLRHGVVCRVSPTVPDNLNKTRLLYAVRWDDDPSREERGYLEVGLKLEERGYLEEQSKSPAFEGQASITLRYEWDMGHRLPKHEGKCQRLHGHRYVAEVTVLGPVRTEGSAHGMVVDFGDVKTSIKTLIGEWDHRTMLWREDPLQASGSVDDQVGIFRVPFMPTAENIAQEILRLLQGSLKGVVRVRVYETPNGWAEAI